MRGRCLLQAAGPVRVAVAATELGEKQLQALRNQFLVGIGKRTAARPFAFHLFFRRQAQQAKRWELLDTDPGPGSVTGSVSLATK